MKIMLFVALPVILTCFFFMKQNFFSFLMMMEMFFLIYAFSIAFHLTSMNFWNFYFWYFVIVTMSAVASIYMMIFNSRMMGKINMSFYYD